MNSPKNPTHDGDRVKEAVQAFNDLPEHARTDVMAWQPRMDALAERYADYLLNAWVYRQSKGEKLENLMANHENDLHFFGVREENMDVALKTVITVLAKRILRGGGTESVDNLRSGTRGDIGGTFSQN